MFSLKKTFLLVALCFIGFSIPVMAISNELKVGIIIMHGKGGSPTRMVLGLANTMKDAGFLVSNIEMPWSSSRDYNVNVYDAEKEVDNAISNLRKMGANKVFVAGHSQGGAFALHFAGKHHPDGIICIAPGGNVGNKIFREKLGDTVERAKKLVAQGKGNDKVELFDFEGKKGVYSIITEPIIYLTWFDPKGAMNMNRAAKEVNPEIPILWLVPKNDYPGLRKTNIPLFNMLPKNPHTKLFEPNSDHVGAPSASVDEIIRWISEVVAISQ